MSTQTFAVGQQRFLVVDDHEAILEGTVPALKKRYPQAQIETAKTKQSAEEKINEISPGLFDLVVVDLSLPETEGAPARTEVGIQLLNMLMTSPEAPNIMVLSTNIKPLFRLKPRINAYGGGFVAMDKAYSIATMLDSVEVALRGSIYLPPEVRSRPEFDRRWLQVLELKYHEGLSDKAIAREMGLSDRTIRNYWSRIQDALNIYDDPNKDLRIQIQIAARKAGLIH
ncbi:MAG: response regulator transcription factor [Cyanobacteria bacterium J06554_11]